MTVLGAGGQEPHDQGVQGLRNLRVRLPRAARRTLRVLGGHVRWGGDVERDPPGEHLVEDHAQRVQVARRADPPAGRLLGGHVPRAAQDVPGLGDGGGLGCPGDAEVRDLRVSGPREEDVAGLDVAVDDAPPVGRLQRLRHLDGQLHRLMR